MLFRGNIDESDVGKISDGMPVKVKIGALQGIDFDAVLTYISPKSEEVNNVVMFEIEAGLEIPDSVFVRAGYSANAEIITDRKENVMSIENSQETLPMWRFSRAWTRKSRFSRERM